MSNQKRLAAVVLIVGVALTILAGWLAAHYYERAEDQQITLQTDNATYAVKVALDRVAIAVQAVRALYASDWVTTDQFGRFSRSLTSSEAIRSLTFYRRVAQESRRQYEARLNADPARLLGIWRFDDSGRPVRAPQKSSYYVVEAAYLQSGEQPNYGLDVTSLPGRSQAIEDAVENFELVASDPLQFANSTDRGVFLYVPTLDRTGSIVGVAAGSITLTDLANVAERASGVASIDIAAGPEITGSSQAEGQSAQEPPPNRRSFEFGNRQWVVTVTPSPQTGGFSYWTTILILGAGLATTAAILGYLTNRANTAEIARGRARLRGMLDGLGPLAWLLAPDGTIVNANRAAVATFGRAKESGVGKPFWELPLSSNNPDQVDRLRQAVFAATKKEDVRFDLPVEEENERTVIDLWIRPITSSQGEPSNLVASAVDVTDRYDSEETQKLLMRELDHRMKNTLQVIQAIIRRTAKSHASVQNFEASLIGRVNAMSRAHELLAQERWHGADLATIVHQETGNFDTGGGSLTVNGPSIRLNPKAALSIALAIHELGTNASKYGALSSSQGRVDVSWRVDRSGNEPCVILSWKEMGGPKVEVPKNRGFGSLLIERSIAFELQGEAKLEYLCEGVVCTISAPLRAVRPFVEAPPSNSMAEPA